MSIRQPLRYPFRGNETHTLGVELEMQLVDPESGQLVNRIGELLERVPPEYADAFKPEFMQCYCEINSRVCSTVDEVRSDLTDKLRWAASTLDELGLRFAWAGAHPTSPWQDQLVSPGDRYAWLLDTMQYVARRLICFGLHVHVGVDSGDKAIQMCDRLQRHLPTLLALSANSPFWCGRDTGLQSHRSKLMEALPTAGLPQLLRNWSEYVWLVDNLIETGFIHSIREIWWDVRPHAEFGTVEIRIMDQPLNMRHVLGLVALTQSIVAGISADIDRGAYLYDSHPAIAKHNKWHATRYGMDATFVDFDTMNAIPAAQVARRLVDHCRSYAERLGCERELGYVDDILQHGTGAQRQRRVFEETGSLHAVVEFLAEEAAGFDLASAR